MTKLNLTCGSCLFLNRDKVFQHKCSELGKIATSKACASHKADAFQVIGSEQAVSRLSHMSSAMRDLSVAQLQAMAALLLGERTTRKHGWRFYQRVYIRMSGSASSNYLNNFAVGYVVSADKEYVRIVGESGKTMISALNDPDSTTVYTVARFKPLREEMVKNKQFHDLTSVRSSYVRPLDDFLESDKPVSKAVTKSKTREDDLCSIVAKLAAGVSLKPARRSKSKSGELAMDWLK